MAYIRTQFLSGAVAPVDMPPFLAYVDDVTEERVAPTQSWFTIPTGFPTFTDTDIVANFILKSGTHSGGVTGLGHITLKKSFNVSNKSDLIIKAKIAHTGANSSHHQIYKFMVAKNGVVLATSDSYRVETSTTDTHTFTCDLTGIDAIDEIILSTYTYGGSASADSTLRWTIKQSEGSYIKFV